MARLKTYTHIGELTGDARSGDRTLRIYLRKSPSGNRWIDSRGRRYRLTGGGYTGAAWPLWHLQAETIRELKEPVVQW
jgi:hypothetical protein